MMNAKRIMRPLLFIIYFSLLGYVSAQDLPSPNYNKEVGVSLPLFSRLDPLSRFNPLGKNHSLSYRTSIKKDYFLELGTSFQIGNRLWSFEKLDLENGTNFSMQTNVVYGKIIPAKENLDWYFGVELINSLEIREEKYPDEDVFGNPDNYVELNQMRSIGFLVGPTLGIQYNLTERLGLYVDGGVYTGVSLDKNQSTYSDRIGKSIEHKLNFRFDINIINSLMAFYKF